MGPVPLSRHPLRQRHAHSGFRFRPWRRAEAIAGGADILDYLRETAREHHVDEHIVYGRKVVEASWSSEQARWTVTVEDTATGTRSSRTCGLLFLCSGYYSYDKGYTPDWPGLEDFGGQLVHPQAWPADLDLAGKRVTVVGSGATAVTLLPELASQAEHVTMLQRSPSYVLSMPAADPLGALLRKVLPEQRALAALRWWNVRTGTWIYRLSRRRPALIRRLLTRDATRRLPPGFDVAAHFTPTYEPWDQRMCLSPGGDFFTALHSGRAEVMTDTVQAFTPAGLRLGSGAELPADVVVTATGLNLLPLGGIALTVDGDAVRIPERVAYKAMMLDGVPNLAFALGYTNASWTLKVDLVCAFVARMLAGMQARGEAVVTPRLPAEPMVTSPFIDMTSGYFERSRAALPLQGDRPPWRLQQDYLKDAPLFTGSTRDDALEYRAGAAVLEPTG